MLKSKRALKRKQILKLRRALKHKQKQKLKPRRVLKHKQALKRRQALKPRRALKRRQALRHNLILTLINRIIMGIIILFFVAVFSMRLLNQALFRLPNGVQEKVYVQLGDIDQFINIRGTSSENPVVIWLHGGPAAPDTFMTTTFQQELESDYTFIRWDQRGCGRTYYKNKTAPISWELLFSDLNELVDYASMRFGQPIVIVGHSWGSVLGSTYAAVYPEKIAGYIGVGQLTDFRESEKLATEEAIQRAYMVGNENDAVKILELYQSYILGGKAVEKPTSKEFLQVEKLRQLTGAYLSPNGRDSTLTLLTSPDFGWNDLRWQLRTKINTESFYSLNQSLFTAMSIFSVPHAFEVPVVFLQGEHDYICSTALVQEYQNMVEAPRVEIFIMPELGHSPMIDDPVVFADTLKRVLDIMI